jgi:hypothetical protein
MQSVPEPSVLILIALGAVVVVMRQVIRLRRTRVARTALSAVDPPRTP